MMRLPAALLLLGAGGLAGCGALDPYPTAPRPLADPAAATPRVAICYNPAHTTLASLQPEAQQECAAGNPRSVAVPAETDWYLQNCPLLLPARANFTCIARR